MPRRTCALSKKSLEPHFSAKIRELQCIADKYGEYFKAGVTVQNQRDSFLADTCAEC